MVLELFAVAAIYYLLLTTLWDFFQNRIEKRLGQAAPRLSANQRR
jgi:polar amino acid transport system permease protein